jgi:hypothetical protein
VTPQEQQAVDDFVARWRVLMADFERIAQEYFGRLIAEMQRLEDEQARRAKG